MSTKLTNTREGLPTHKPGKSDLYPSRQRRIDQQHWEEGRAYYGRSRLHPKPPGHDTVELERFQCELCVDTGLHVGEVPCPRCSPEPWPIPPARAILLTPKALVGVALLIACMGGLIGALL